MRPPDDPFHERLVAAYPQIRRFLPLLIDAVAMESTAPARPVLDAYRALGTWLAERPRTTRLPDTEVPMGVVTPSWEPHVRDRETGTVDRAAYACCVLDRLRVGLRRRDVYTPGSVRWGDPRAELLSPETWEQRREQACEDLALDTDPARVVANLAQTLASAWRRTADGMPNNPDLRIEHRDGADRIVVTPLDAVEEPASLVELRGMVEALLPEVEIADLPLEVHGWTGFLDEYTHISGAPSRAAGLVESLSALLVSEACNVGLTPVVDEDYPPLTRDRLNWTAHNYFRSATHAAASTRLFDYHADLDLARDAWGGGEMASADGMRFVIPVATIHAGYNPRYFGRQRGSTLYTWMADTHSTFHQTLIPGTERDSLYALDGLMANQTVLRPDTVSTDTAGASEIVFALAWALGYRYGPRLADLADHRLWVIDARADYGPLQGLARNRANTSLISGQWDQICRLAASLEARTVTPNRRRRRRASPHGREPHPPRRGSQPAAAPVAGRGNPRGHEDRRRPRSPPLPGRLSRHRPGHSSGPGRRRAGAPGASRPATPRSSPGRRRCAEAMSRSGSGASSTSSGRRSYCAGPRTSSTWPSCTSGSPSLLPGRNPSLTTPVTAVAFRILHGSSSQATEQS